MKALSRMKVLSRNQARKLFHATRHESSFTQPGKLHQLIDGCINNGIDLVAIQEHRWQTQEQDSTHLEYIDETTWRFEYSTATIEGQGGVGLLISPKLTKYLSSTGKISDRILVASFRGNPQLRS
jgi:hypothetical protein